MDIDSEDWSEYLSDYISPYQTNPICTFLRFGKIFIVTLSGTLKNEIPTGKDAEFSPELPIKNLSYNGIPELRANCGMLKTWDGKVSTLYIQNKKICIGNYGYGTNIGKVFCHGFIIGMIS